MKILSNVDESAKVINAGDEEGWAPIHSAASIGNTEILEILLSKGHKLNSCLQIACHAVMLMGCLRLSFFFMLEWFLREPLITILGHLAYYSVIFSHKKL